MKLKLSKAFFLILLILCSHIVQITESKFYKKTKRKFNKSRRGGIDLKNGPTIKLEKFAYDKQYQYDSTEISPKRFVNPKPYELDKLDKRDSKGDVIHVTLSVFIRENLRDEFCLFVYQYSAMKKDDLEKKRQTLWDNQFSKIGYAITSDKKYDFCREINVYLHLVPQLCENLGNIYNMKKEDFELYRKLYFSEYKFYKKYHRDIRLYCDKGNVDKKQYGQKFSIFEGKPQEEDWQEYNGGYLNTIEFKDDLSFGYPYEIVTSQTGFFSRYKFYYDLKIKYSVRDQFCKILYYAESMNASEYYNHAKEVWEMPHNEIFFFLKHFNSDKTLQQKYCQGIDWHFREFFKTEDENKNICRMVNTLFGSILKDPSIDFYQQMILPKNNFSLFKLTQENQAFFTYICRRDTKYLTQERYLSLIDLKPDESYFVGIQIFFNNYGPDFLPYYVEANFFGKEKSIVVNKKFLTEFCLFLHQIQNIPKSVFLSKKHLGWMNPFVKKYNYLKYYVGSLGITEECTNMSPESFHSSGDKSIRDICNLLNEVMDYTLEEFEKFKKSNYLYYIWFAYDYEKIKDRCLKLDQFTFKNLKHSIFYGKPPEIIDYEKKSFEFEILNEQHNLSKGIQYKLVKDSKLKLSIRNRHFANFCRYAFMTKYLKENEYLKTTELWKNDFNALYNLVETHRKIIEDNCTKDQTLLESLVYSNPDIQDICNLLTKLYLNQINLEQIQKHHHASYKVILEHQPVIQNKCEETTKLKFPRVYSFRQGSQPINLGNADPKVSIASNFENAEERLSYFKQIKSWRTNSITINQSYIFELCVFLHEITSMTENEYVTKGNWSWYNPYNAIYFDLVNFTKKEKDWRSKFCNNRVFYFEKNTLPLNNKTAVESICKDLGKAEKMKRNQFISFRNTQYSLYRLFTVFYYELRNECIDFGFDSHLDPKLPHLYFKRQPPVLNFDRTPLVISFIDTEIPSSFPRYFFLYEEKGNRRLDIPSSLKTEFCEYAKIISYLIPENYKLYSIDLWENKFNPLFDLLYRDNGSVLNPNVCPEDSFKYEKTCKTLSEFLNEKDESKIKETIRNNYSILKVIQIDKDFIFRKCQHKKFKPEEILNQTISYLQSITLKNNKFKNIVELEIESEGISDDSNASLEDNKQISPVISIPKQLDDPVDQAFSLLATAKSTGQISWAFITVVSELLVSLNDASSFEAGSKMDQFLKFAQLIQTADQTAEWFVSCKNKFKSFFEKSSFFSDLKSKNEFDESVIDDILKKNSLLHFQVKTIGISILGASKYKEISDSYNSEKTSTSVKICLKVKQSFDQSSEGFTNWIHSRYDELRIIASQNENFFKTISESFYKGDTFFESVLVIYQKLVSDRTPIEKVLEIIFNDYLDHEESFNTKAYYKELMTFLANHYNEYVKEFMEMDCQATKIQKSNGLFARILKYGSTFLKYFNNASEIFVDCYQVFKRFVTTSGDQDPLKKILSDLTVSTGVRFDKVFSIIHSAKNFSKGIIEKIDTQTAKAKDFFIESQEKKQEKISDDELLKKYVESLPGEEEKTKWNTAYEKLADDQKQKIQEFQNNLRKEEITELEYRLVMERYNKIDKSSGEINKELLSLFSNKIKSDKPIEQMTTDELQKRIQALNSALTSIQMRIEEYRVENLSKSLTGDQRKRYAASMMPDYEKYFVSGTLDVLYKQIVYENGKYFQRKINLEDPANYSLVLPSSNEKVTNLINGLLEDAKARKVKLSEKENEFFNYLYDNYNKRLDLDAVRGLLKKPEPNSKGLSETDLAYNENVLRLFGEMNRTIEKEQNQDKEQHIKNREDYNNLLDEVTKIKVTSKTMYRISMRNLAFEEMTASMNDDPDNLEGFMLHKYYSNPTNEQHERANKIIQKFGKIKDDIINTGVKYARNPNIIFQYPKNKIKFLNEYFKNAAQKIGNQYEIVYSIDPDDVHEIRKKSDKEIKTKLEQMLDKDDRNAPTSLEHLKSYKEYFSSVFDRKKNEKLTEFKYEFDIDLDGNLIYSKVPLIQTENLPKKSFSQKLKDAKNKAFIWLSSKDGLIKEQIDNDFDLIIEPDDFGYLYMTKKAKKDQTEPKIEVINNEKKDIQYTWIFEPDDDMNVTYRKVPIIVNKEESNLDQIKEEVKSKQKILSRLFNFENSEEAEEFFDDINMGTIKMIRPEVVAELKEKTVELYQDYALFVINKYQNIQKAKKKLTEDVKQNIRQLNVLASEFYQGLKEDAKTAVEKMTKLCLKLEGELMEDPGKKIKSMVLKSSQKVTEWKVEVKKYIETSTPYIELKNLKIKFADLIKNTKEDNIINMFNNINKELKYMYRDDMKDFVEKNTLVIKNFAVSFAKREAAEFMANPSQYTVKLLAELNRYKGLGLFGSVLVVVGRRAFKDILATKIKNQSESFKAKLEGSKFATKHEFVTSVLKGMVDTFTEDMITLLNSDNLKDAMNSYLQKGMIKYFKALGEDVLAKKMEEKFNQEIKTLADNNLIKKIPGASKFLEKFGNEIVLNKLIEIIKTDGKKLDAIKQTFNHEMMKQAKEMAIKTAKEESIQKLKNGVDEFAKELKGMQGVNKSEEVQKLIDFVSAKTKNDIESFINDKNRKKNLVDKLHNIRQGKIIDESTKKQLTEFTQNLIISKSEAEVKKLSDQIKNLDFIKNDKNLTDIVDEIENLSKKQLNSFVKHKNKKQYLLDQFKSLKDSKGKTEEIDKLIEFSQKKIMESASERIQKGVTEASNYLKDIPFIKSVPGSEKVLSFLTKELNGNISDFTRLGKKDKKEFLKNRINDIFNGKELMSKEYKEKIRSSVKKEIIEDVLLLVNSNTNEIKKVISENKYFKMIPGGEKILDKVSDDFMSELKIMSTLNHKEKRQRLTNLFNKAMEGVNPLDEYSKNLFEFSKKEIVKGLLSDVKSSVSDIEKVILSNEFMKRLPGAQSILQTISKNLQDNIQKFSSLDPLLQRKFIEDSFNDLIQLQNPVLAYSTEFSMFALNEISNDLSKIGLDQIGSLKSKIQSNKYFQIIPNADKVLDKVATDLKLELTNFKDLPLEGKKNKILKVIEDAIKTENVMENKYISEMKDFAYKAFKEGLKDRIEGEDIHIKNEVPESKIFEHKSHLKSFIDKVSNDIHKISDQLNNLDYEELKEKTNKIIASKVYEYVEPEKQSFADKLHSLFLIVGQRIYENPQIKLIVDSIPTGKGELLIKSIANTIGLQTKAISIAEDWKSKFENKEIVKNAFNFFDKIYSNDSKSFQEVIKDSIKLKLDAFKVSEDSKNKITDAFISKANLIKDVLKEMKGDFDKALEKLLSPSHSRKYRKLFRFSQISKRKLPQTNEKYKLSNFPLDYTNNLELIGLSDQIKEGLMKKSEDLLAHSINVDLSYDLSIKYNSNIEEEEENKEVKENVVDVIQNVVTRFYGDSIKEKIEKYLLKALVKSALSYYPFNPVAIIKTIKGANIVKKTYDLVSMTIRSFEEIKLDYNKDERTNAVVNVFKTFGTLSGGLIRLFIAVKDFTDGPEDFIANKIEIGGKVLFNNLKEYSTQILKVGFGVFRLSLKAISNTYQIIYRDYQKGLTFTEILDDLKNKAKAALWKGVESIWGEIKSFGKRVASVSYSIINYTIVMPFKYFFGGKESPIDMADIIKKSNDDQKNIINNLDSTKADKIMESVVEPVQYVRKVNEEDVKRCVILGSSSIHNEKEYKRIILFMFKSSKNREEINKDRDEQLNFYKTLRIQITEKAKNLQKRLKYRKWKRR